MNEDAGTPRTEDLARRILDTRAANQSSALFGVWAFWWSVVAFVALLTGSTWLLAVSGLAALFSYNARRNEDASASAVLMADLKPESLGSLIELLQWPSARVRDVARWCATGILIRHDPASPFDLTPVQRATLYDTLTPLTAYRHPDFVQAVLSALPSIADEQALPAVMRLVRMKPWSKRMGRIREAARAMLPAIEARILSQRDESGPVHGEGDARMEAPEAPRRAYGAEFGMRPQMRLGFLLAAWLIIVPFGGAKALQLALDGQWLDALFFAVPAAASTQLHRLTMMGRHARLARELMNEDDIEAIGRLAEAATWPDARLKAAAISALTRLLPRLKASDAGMLTSAQRGCLNLFLNAAEARAHPDLVVALLGALEQVGDMAAVPYVRSLAQMPTKSARLAAIRDAAQQCLPALMERARVNTDHQTLLRPASAPGPPEETLLRPAMPDKAAAEIALLVRPAETHRDPT